MPADRVWVETSFSGMFLVRGSGVYFQLGALLGGWGRAFRVCLRGQGPCLIHHCVLCIKEKVRPRGNVNKYLSEDYLWKGNLCNGVSGGVSQHPYE